MNNNPKNNTIRKNSRGIANTALLGIAGVIVLIVGAVAYASYTGSLGGALGISKDARGILLETAEIHKTLEFANFDAVVTMSAPSVLQDVGPIDAKITGTIQMEPTEAMNETKNLDGLVESSLFSIEFLKRDKTYYVRVPELSGSLATTYGTMLGQLKDTYLKIDETEAQSYSNAQANLEIQGLIEEAKEDLYVQDLLSKTKVMEDEVNGQAMYKITLVTSKESAEPYEDKSAMAASIVQESASNTTTLWIGQYDGYVHKIYMDSKSLTPDAGTTDFTLEAIIKDHNKAISFETPTNTVSFQELLQGMISLQP